MYEMNEQIKFRLYTEKKIELKLAQFVLCVTSRRSSLPMFQFTEKKKHYMACRH